MTKKQIIATSVIAVILIGLIIAVSVYGKSKNTIDDSQSNFCSEPERRQLAADIGSGVLESETNNTGTPGSKGTSASGSNSAGNSDSTSSSAGGISSTGGSGNYKTYKAALPETSGYPIPKTNHFSLIEGSLKPGDPQKAELKIYLDCERDFEKQLKELEGIIQPILGPSVTKEIISYMKTKTSRSVPLDKWWETNNKEINVSSGYDSYIVEFLSWKKQ
jgi:hypothetical protein